MGQNVKKRNAHDIYYGLDQETGVLKHISDVPSGAGCACNCIACGTPLEARKGKVRKHHFAHKSNYECMYAAEVSVYKAVAAIITESGHIALPPIFITFPAWQNNEFLKEAQILKPEQVSFECAPLQYPPQLILVSQNSRLRLLLEFGAYYSEEDLAELISEAESENYSLLLYHLPPISKDRFFAPDSLKTIFQGEYADSKWIRSALVDKRRKWYLSMAIEPKRWGNGYECAIHADKFRGKYSAQWLDCAYCEFNLATPPKCLCLAAGESRVPLDIQKRIIECRLKNDTSNRSQVYMPAIPHPTGLPENPLFRSEEEFRIKKSFDPDSTEPILDKLGRRWIMCRYCGEIKPSHEMVAYGGINSCNKGVCSACMKAGKTL